MHMKRFFTLLRELPAHFSLKLCLTFGLVYVLFFVRSVLFLDPDFGWHLEAGNYFVHHGFPATDVFTFTASDFPWVSHEWMHDVLVYAVHQTGGYAALAALFALLWTAAFWIVGRNMHPALLFLAVLAVLPFSGIRTLTWSVLFLVVLIKTISYKKGRFVPFLPLLFLVWANVHGSFVVGFAYLIFVAIQKKSIKLAAVAVASVAVTFINPYGARVYGEIISTLGDSSLHSRIFEWQSFYIQAATMPYVIAWAAVTAFGFRKTWRQWRQYVRLDIVFFLASMSQNRHLPLFVMVSLPYTARGVADIIALLPKTLDRPRKRFVRIMTAVFVLATLVAGYVTFHHTTLDKENSFPVAAVEYLRAHPCQGNMFNSYDYGGYLIWKLPSQKVYIDGRMPSWEFNGQKYMDDYYRFQDDATFRYQQVKQYGISCALVDVRYDATIKALQKQGWESVVRDESSVLLIKAKSEND